MKKQVITVEGPVPPDDLGITDAHNHLWISEMELNNPGPVLDQSDLILAELQDYRERGGTSQLDCQPGGAGRNGNQLLALSRQSGVKIVCCTGYHLCDYYPEDAAVWEMDHDQAARFFLDEIQGGLEETRKTSEVVFPGFIKAAVREDLSNTSLALLEGAVLASLESGYLIEMHTQKGAGIEQFLEQIEEWGLPFDRLVICHIDKRPDFGLHRELAESGCLLEYDTFFRPKYHPEKHVWPLLKKMVFSGYAGQIALATDLAESSLWNSYGGSPGLAGFPDLIGKRTQNEFNNDTLTDSLLGGNIAGRLAVANKES